MNVQMVSRVRMNPYTRLLAEGLERAQPGLCCTQTESLLAGRFDIIHLHWFDLLYAARSPWRRVLKLASLAKGLQQARRGGAHLVYTAHNVEPHERAGLLQRAADALVYRLADAVHVHDESAQRALAAQRTVRRVDVIAHGNYIGAYPDTCTRAAARQRLGLAGNVFVYVALGQIRPYKGLDELISAFRGLPGSRLALVIAGNLHDPAYGRLLEKQAGGDRRIRLEPHFVSDDEVQYYFRAADVCVLPYRAATTSGAAILALSFGCPVVAPDLGPFRSLLVGASGLLYPSGANGLKSALAAATDMPPQQAHTAALALARSLDWDGIARQHVAVYEAIHHE